MEQNNINIENNQNKINELLSELSEAREDERNSQNQILQIISIVGTILSILFGTSYLSSGNKNTGFQLLQDYSSTLGDSWFDILLKSFLVNVTPARVVFWLSALSFIIAFLYIIYLGIQNILRYYHIQNIEERLCGLVSQTCDDNIDRGTFLHWNAFSAPILTKNKKHIASSHAAISYFVYSGSIICILLFSMGIVTAQFLVISPNRWFDQLTLGVVNFTIRREGEY